MKHHTRKTRKVIAKHKKGEPCPYCQSRAGFYGNSYGKIRREYSCNIRLIKNKDRVTSITHDPICVICLSCNQKVKIA